MAYNSLLSISMISTLFIFNVAGRAVVSDDGYGGILRFNPFVSVEEESTEVCKQTYGFMPCTHSAIGNIFLISVYGYLIFLAARYISSACEMLLQILRPGLVGGLLLPVLGALPESLLILVSGLSGSAKVAQGQISVGMGLLAGSTVMLLTVTWGTCIFVGKCDIKDSVAIDNQDTKPLRLISSGVSTDIWTSYSAMIMAASVLPLIVLQFAQILHSTSEKHLEILLSFIVSVSLLIAYCIYQVIQPQLQKRRLVYTKHKNVRSRILLDLEDRSLGRLLDDQGQPNLVVMNRLFDSIDVNGNKRLSYSEIKALLVGLDLYDIDLDQDDAIDNVLKDFDVSHNHEVEFEEFVIALQKWLEQAKGSKRGRFTSGPDTMKYVHDNYVDTNREQHLLGDAVNVDEDEEGMVDDPHGTLIRGVQFLILGTLFTATFANPLVDAVDNFSTAINVPSFFVSFILLPFATNSSEAMSAIIIASRKKKRSASLTFSELYGAVTMNNILCLSIFLALVYTRGLTWDFSSEVLVILIVCVVMGIFSSLRTTFPLWTSIIAFSLYPLSLGLVYVLDYGFGWS